MGVARSAEPQVSLTKASWTPPARRTRPGATALAYKSASKWAKHLMGVFAYFRRALVEFHRADLTIPLGPPHLF